MGPILHIDPIMLRSDQRGEGQCPLYVGSFRARAGRGPTPLERDGLLDGGVPPEAVAETLVALSKEGSRLATRKRHEITLVEEAPGGRRWRLKL